MGRSITGRDGYLIGEALALAIAVDRALPRERQTLSNREDMLEVLRGNYSPGMVAYFEQAAHVRMTDVLELAEVE